MPLATSIGNTLITGASSGLGAAIALRLARRGTKVFALSRDAERLADLKKQGGGYIEIFSADVTDRESLVVAIDDIEACHGGVEVLINNAGWNHSGEFAQLDFDSLDRIVDVNLKGTLYTTRLVVPHMIARRRGRIINIASVAGTRGIATEAAYCASKHGMVGFADALAQELIPHGILVTSLCPGGIDTPWWRRGDNNYPLDKSQLMNPDDLAELVEFTLLQPANTLYKRVVFFPTTEWH